MKKKSLILVTIAILVLALAGCSQPAATPSTTAPPASSSTSEASSATTPQGPPVAADVWTSTISSGAYKSWPPAPGYSTMQPAKGPHGKFVQIYFNPTMQDTLNAPPVTTWPVGSMIVKDAYDASKALMQIEYMQKTDAGWYYASFTPDGTAAVEGVMVEPCNGCHTKAPTTDGVKSFKPAQ